MSLVVMRLWGGITEQFTLDWVGEAEEKYKTFIACDPVIDCGKGEFNNQPIVLREFGGHKWYFSVPDGVAVQTPDKWKSDSGDSEMLYPWWWSLDGRVIACQIAPPRSESSPHYHNGTVEVFVPVMNNQGTFLQLGGEKQHLSKETRVGLGIQHQVVNRAYSPSVQLLNMMGPVHFPDRSDHVPCEKPASSLV